MNAHGVGYPQQFPANFIYPQQQNKGTLPPGQVIQIQSLTVTVERFLSQGGFAHVYLVRSATPVNGTNHHVLKRMLVADEGMLQDVKKEVDIMRILRGHANIVNLIDSAWNRLADGRYEVFILMEYCAGGGIIDMMNRRLRERLTEGEILQIFVDVCEGVAAMHHLRPALLHRDLKVENILQANENSYKLCDFGSATTVTKAPTTVAEMRALESDLNKHTTLQYRAPEMVDPHLRRPIDEKSDVWALGVLLYKLCYYTTPFEEHGPLAILNVQYKIPPYPVYSPQMLGLITSVLREHGTQRPSVFEILETVHRMRGTKSRYRYNHQAPTAVPTLPRSPDIVTFKQSDIAVPSTSGAAQARQTVLDAIAPMRRGRPIAGGVGSGMYADDMDLPTPRGAHFRGVTTNERWTAPREAPAILGVGKPVHEMRSSSKAPAHEETKSHKGPWDGLGSLDATEKASMNGFGDTFESSLGSLKHGVLSPAVVQSPPAGLGSSPSDQSHMATILPSTTPQQSRFTMPTPSRLLQAPRPPMQTKPKDSFDGISGTNIRPSSGSPMNNGPVSAFSRPSTAADSVASAASTGTGVSSAAVVEGSAAQSAAERFPPIEQLDLLTRGKVAPMGPRAPSPLKPVFSQGRSPGHSQLSKMSITGGLSLEHDTFTPPQPNPMNGIRSQQVTGTAMRGAGITPPSHPNVPSVATNVTPPTVPPVPPTFSHTPATPTRFPTVERPPNHFPTAERPAAPNRKPMLTRRHRSNLSLKGEMAGQQQSQEAQEVDLLGSNLIENTGQPLLTQRTPSPSSVPQRDWLTGDDIVLQTIAKAATGSMQPRLPTPDPAYVDPNKAKRATMGSALISNGRIGATPAGSRAPIDAIVAGWQRNPGGLAQYQSPPLASTNTQPISTSTAAGIALPGMAKRPSQEGNIPSALPSSLPTSHPIPRGRSSTVSRMPTQMDPSPLLPPRPSAQNLRAASPQGKPFSPELSDNWSPVEQKFPTSFGDSRRLDDKRSRADSSSDEGPEDVNASSVNRLRMREKERKEGLSPTSRTNPVPNEQRVKDDAFPRKHQARQSSVHDLVDLWNASRSPATGQVSQDDASVGSSRSNHQRTSSKDLINFNEPSTLAAASTQNAYSRAVFLFPPVDAVDRRQSPSSGSGSEKDTDAPRPQPQKRFSGSKSRPSHLPLDRTRPQSLFIPPGLASSSSLRNSPPGDVSNPSPTSAAPRARSPRRTSISGMVSHYEALSAVSTTSGYSASTESGPASPKPKPVVATKPAALRATASTVTSPVLRKVAVPKGVASAQPGILPTYTPSEPSTTPKDAPKMNAPIKMRTSPLLFQSIDSPSDVAPSYGYNKEPERIVESHYGLGQNLQAPAMEIKRGASPVSQQGSVSDVNEEVVLVSPRPKVVHQAIETHLDAPARAVTPPAGQSPSPEQSYKGVGRLIDQWQKKSEEAEGKSRSGLRPGGPRLQKKDIIPGRSNANN